MEIPKKYSSSSPEEGLNSPEDVDLSGCCEKQLWDQFRTGSKQAFDIIYDRYFQILCSYGDRICADKGTVEDVIQDLFIYLWMKKKYIHYKIINKG